MLFGKNNTQLQKSNLVNKYQVTDNQNWIAIPYIKFKRMEFKLKLHCIYIFSSDHITCSFKTL